MGNLKTRKDKAMNQRDDLVVSVGTLSDLVSLREAVQRRLAIE
jgi:hypothetical protein